MRFVVGPGQRSGSHFDRCVHRLGRSGHRPKDDLDFEIFFLRCYVDAWVFPSADVILSVEIVVWHFKASVRV